jgi:hypothetical protein
MWALAVGLLLAAAPTGPATKLVAIWLDHGAAYMELRPDGSGRIGALENTWSVDKDQLHIVQKESGDAFDIPFTLLEGGKQQQLKLLVQGSTVMLERSKKAPAATAPPPPKPLSAVDPKDEPDAGIPKKKAKKKK